MARVVVSARADADIDEIVHYLAERGGRPVVAKYLELFAGAYARLARHPRIGPTRPRLGANARIAIVDPYLLIYDWDAADDIVTILRIVRGRRRLTRRLAREP